MGTMARVPVRPRPPYQPSRPSAGRAAVALAVTGLVVLALAHGIGQHTADGRAFDLAAEGALIDRSWRVRLALLRLLGMVTVASLAVVLGVLVAVAAVRRRWWTAPAVALLVGGSTVMSRILKYEVLERPDLPRGSDNSLPSGHSTIACAVALALLLIVPSRWRGWTAGLAAFLGTGGGLATLAAGTHRPVDVVAAVGVCALWTAPAVLIALRDQHTRRPRTPPRWSVRVVAASAAGAVLPAGTVVVRLAGARPAGWVQGGVLALVIGALVAVTVVLTVRALGSGAVPADLGD